MSRWKLKTEMQSENCTATHSNAFAQLDHTAPVFDGVTIALEPRQPGVGSGIEWTELVFSRKLEFVKGRVERIVSALKGRQKSQSCKWGSTSIGLRLLVNGDKVTE